jgi:hypothetical protein
VVVCAIEHDALAIVADNPDVVVYVEVLTIKREDA